MIPQEPPQDNTAGYEGETERQAVAGALAKLVPLLQRGPIYEDGLFGETDSPIQPVPVKDELKTSDLVLFVDFCFCHVVLLG
jgi:hypothetical protein